MKTIGLIGGMSWESTIPYYRIVNETIKERLGGLHSAKVVLYSMDFQEIERLQHATEISMLVGSQDSPVPVFDTTSIHARHAAEWALGDNIQLSVL